MIEVPMQLKGVVDKWACQHSTNEVGGVLFGEGLRFEAFLPLPNASTKPQEKYLVPEGYNAFCTAMADFLGRERLAFLHTHPNGTPPSEKDIRGARSWACPWCVVLSRIDRSHCIWTIMDGDGKVVDAIYPDVPLETTYSLLAQRLGLLDLGRCFIDEHGAVHSEQNGMGILLDNADARRIWTLLPPMDASPYPYKYEIVEKARALGMTAAATGRALTNLIEAGLAEHWYTSGFRAVRKKL